MVDPKQLGIFLTDVMSCPLLWLLQQAPNAPCVFALHSFCNVVLSAARSSPAAQTRTVARTRKRDMARESFISCCWEMCVGKGEEKKKKNRREKPKRQIQNDDSHSATKRNWTQFLPLLACSMSTHTQTTRAHPRPQTPPPRALSSSSVHTPSRAFGSSRQVQQVQNNGLEGTQHVAPRNEERQLVRNLSGASGDRHVQRRGARGAQGGPC